MQPTGDPEQHRRHELAAFLRSRRQRVDPRDRGFEPGRRRAPGLRREEVAALAGVSSSWYIRLEQGRGVHPSAQVLSSIARALSLDDAELEYLLRLGGHAPAQRSRDRDGRHLQALLDGFLPNPASILTPAFDYVAWNRASESIVPGFLGCGSGTPNILRFLFGAPLPPELLGAPEGPVALIGELRSNSARHPDDAAIRTIADELCDTSVAFADVWRRREVAVPRPPANVSIEHPESGPLVFSPISLRPELQPELTIVLFLPSDEATAVALDRFGA